MKLELANWRQKAKHYGVAVAIAHQFLVEDPVGFTAKAAEKFRQSNRPLLSVLANTTKSVLQRYSYSPMDEFLDQGELSKAVMWAEQQRRLSRREASLRDSTNDKLKRLDHIFATGCKINRTGVVVHYLTNSLPYTNSGYTMRSQKVLQAQQDAGIATFAITRIGYPLVIGNVPSANQDEIDGITYRRALPKHFPISITRRDAKAVTELVKYCREVGAQAIHTTTDYSNAIVASEAAAQLKIPWVYEVRGELESTWASRRGHDAVNSEFYKKARQAETNAMLAASHVVVLSEIYKKEAISRGVSSERITVIPNAIELGAIQQKPSTNSIRKKRHELGISEENKVVAAITSIVEYEGLETLIKAIKLLPDKFIAVVVGDGIDRPRLEKLSEELGSRVRFVGKQPQNEIDIWYAIADVFVIPRLDLPVTRKVTPIKGLQAQAYGIPIVASDLPALREVTGNIETYVAPGDASALAEAIRQQPSQVNETGIQWAYTRTWEQNSKRYQQIYKD